MARSVCRFIPARAGNGVQPALRSPARAVHPRACGERGPRGPAKLRKNGSSPRVRGTASQGGAGAVHLRFIPARAGTDQRGHARYAYHRFIPARAGNGSRPCAARRTRTVHPRACGERFCDDCQPEQLIGSSPRVRGTAAMQNKTLSSRRFIPARAGNGVPRRKTSRAYSVHPRACGERRCIMSSSGGIHGSSPRVRGTELASLEELRPRRFIPARAGNGMMVSRR